MPKLCDLTGQRFGRLIVVDRAKNNKFNQVCWICQCDCGNTTVVIGSRLMQGKTKSCGCLQKEATANRNYNKGTAKGDSTTKLYVVYKAIKARLYNKNNKSYCNYGGRGIKMCQEWLDDFQSFKKWAHLNGYAEGLTIDRIDVNGDYEPSNCRWVSKAEQAINKRNNHLITCQGETKTLSQWADISGVCHATIIDRISRGWDIEKAIFTLPKEVIKNV